MVYKKISRVLVKGAAMRGLGKCEYSDVTIDTLTSSSVAKNSCY